MIRLPGKFVILALSLATVCPAAYHFIHFDSRTSPWRAIPEKFDVNTLPAKTLTYYITDRTGVQLAPGDSYAGFMSQIRLAAKVWNDVDTSELRLAFGGFAAPETPQSAPALDISFEDLPPGVIAQGAPTVRTEANGQFVPVLRSLVMIRPDLRDYPSFGESLFGTLVHEIGHGLGLQHTFTSGVMSTSITRTTSRSKPLTSDDIAAISLLYPTADFAKSTGVISGRVTMQNSGVNLASVVAISPSGTAISTMTNPDGTYRIEGIPPRSYFVYVHPMPPARLGQDTPGGMVYPRDSNGNELPPSGPFFTTFYPGVDNPSRAATVNVSAGETAENINFSVRSRNGYGIHSVDTRAFPGQVAVKPPYLSSSMTYPFIVASGSGLISGSNPASGLSVSVLGGATLTTKAYSPAPQSYIQIDFDVRTLSFENDSARHLVFSQGGDLYVLPAAFFHVQKAPPSISSVLPLADASQRLAVITGTNLTEGSRVFFDGVAAPVRDFDSTAGRLTVAPPVAASDHRANVVVLNPDGQSSLFLQGDSPSTYSYSTEPASVSAASAGVKISPDTMSTGTEAMLQIDISGGTLVAGQTTVGFGSSDIVVRNFSVVSPTRILANVAIGPNAQLGSTQISIVSGLQVISQAYALQVIPSARSFYLSGKVLNNSTGSASVSAGSTAVLKVGSSPMVLGNNNVTLFLNDKAIPTSDVSNNQITFEVPAGTPVGPAVVRVEVFGEKSLPILLLIDPPTPQIVSASDTASAGQLLALTVRDLQAAGTVPDAASVRVRLGGVDLRVAQVIAQQDSHRVLAVVPARVPVGDDVPLTISIGGRTSDPLNVRVVRAD